MTQRRVLLLDSHRLNAYVCAGSEVRNEGEFAADAPGVEAFGAYLRHHRHSVFMLLADVAEEGFQLEDIPHITGKDRLALIQRKLAQYFYGTPLAMAISQGRLKEGRRDERLLLMALTRPQHFEPWLAALRSAEAIVSGIFSVPQVITGLVAKSTSAVSGRVLVISQSPGGLRQTYFDAGKLRFSRMTVLPTGSRDESAVAAAIEAAKMHQYLLGQRLIERGKQLPVQILVHPGRVEVMREHCRDSAELQFTFVDLLQEAHRLGLKSALADSCAELLFCYLLGKNPPADQFAPAEELYFHRQWRTRRGLKSASGLIFACGLLFAGKLGFDVMQMYGTIGQIEQQTRLDQKSYDVALQALPKIPLSTENLRALVNRYEAALKRAVGPEPLLVQISRSLDVYPDIAIERIEWSISEQITTPGAKGAGAGAPVIPTTIPPNMTSGPYAQAIVAASLPLRLVGNQRSQLALVADFVKHLGAAPDTLVVILQPPVDTQSSKILKSGDTDLAPVAPKFSFLLTRKL